MATKVKPCRIQATGTPQAGYVPKYVDEDTFQWGTGGGGGDVVVSTDTGNELSTGVGLWLGTETDFSSISTPDTNTLYIQYKSDGRLPAEYQEVEYIESDGNSGINTGITPSDSPYLKVEFKMNLGNKYGYFYGAGWGSPWLSFEHAGQGDYWNISSSTILGKHNITAGTDCEYTCTYNNGTFTSAGNYSFNTTYSGTTLGFDDFCIFCADTSLNQTGKYKLYYMKLYQGQNFDLERDLVPCYRKADSVIGLYDLVNDQFYTNIGAGTFTKGPDVN